MARTLNDLTYFTKAIVSMKPWKYDYTVHPISWRDDEESEAKSKSLRIGLMANDGKITLPPAKLLSLTIRRSRAPNASN